MWWDSYPYSSVSVHALHPQYVALRATLDDLPGQQMPADIAADIEAARVSAKVAVFFPAKPCQSGRCRQALQQK
jgi:hypothetical protein